jgi:hypothetical protein
MLVQETPQGIWIERIVDRIPMPYPYVGVIITAFTAFIFFFFTRVVLFFPWEFFHQIYVISLSLLLGIQLTGTIYLFRELRQFFKSFIPGVYDNIHADLLYAGWIRRVYRSGWYYALLVIVFLPFVLLFGGFQYYGREPANPWSLPLDIFTLVTGYFMLYLLVILLWIMINIVWLLQDMGSPEFQPYIRLDILAVDGVGGLKSLQDITVKTLFLYFICITLAIISDVSPFTFLSFESFFRIILLIAGLGVFIFMIHIVRRIVRGRIETEIDKIDAGYRVQQDRLIEISHGKDSDMNLEALNPVKASLDALHTQRQRMLDLYVQCKGYDAVTLVKFSSSFILSLIAFIQKVWEFASKIKPV